MSTNELGIGFCCRISFLLVITILLLFLCSTDLVSCFMFGDLVFWRLTFYLTIKGKLKTCPSLTDHPTTAKLLQLCSPSPSPWAWTKRMGRSTIITKYMFPICRPHTKNKSCKLWKWFKFLFLEGNFPKSSRNYSLLLPIKGGAAVLITGLHQVGGSINSTDQENFVFRLSKYVCKFTPFNQKWHVYLCNFTKSEKSVPSMCCCVL